MTSPILEKTHIENLFKVTRDEQDVLDFYMISLDVKDILRAVCSPVVYAGMQKDMLYNLAIYTKYSGMDAPAMSYTNLPKDSCEQILKDIGLIVR